MKAAVYPEYVCVLHAARALGRPVKWTDERSGSFVSDHHGRAQDMVIELALDENAHILAMRLTGYGNMGGYLAQFGPLLSTLNPVKNIASVYRTPLIEVSTKCVFTNTTLRVGLSRRRPARRQLLHGAAIDLAAAEIGIDRIELRRRNMIRKSELPFKAASGMTYDSGDFPGVLKQALEARRLCKGFKQAQAREQEARHAARPRHRLLSRGHRRARQGTGRHPFRGRWHGDDRHRHARLRHGPRHDLRAGAERHARRSVRPHPPGGGRQRPNGFRRRQRRLALGDVHRHRARRNRRPR